jgi:hypothetical protein
VFSVLFEFLLLFTFIVVGSDLLLFYLITPDVVLYYSYLSIFLTAGVVGLKAYWDLGVIRHDLEFLFPNASNNEERLPNIVLSEADSESKAMRAVTCYRNGASMSKIMTDFELPHVNSARRLIIQGLDILLKEHQVKEVSS